MSHNLEERIIEIQFGPVRLVGNLVIPPLARAVILFAHGSGSGRFSPRNRYVASVLQKADFATLLIDLLTEEEEDIDQITAQFRFDIDLLARRLAGTTLWLKRNPETRNLRLGYFGASTGAAAALIAASQFPEQVNAVVSRGGRPDLAGSALEKVKAPTLFIIGGNDAPVIRLNRIAAEQLPDATIHEMMIIPGATHLFEERGKLEKVAELARNWFINYLVMAPVSQEQ